MAIPTSITDLDTNEAMNSPAGSDNVGGTLDNFLRAHAMIIRRQFSKGANVNSASTTNLPPDCSFLNVVKVVSTINAFSNAFDGRIIYIKFEGGITLAHSASLVMPAGVDVVTEDGDVAVFVNESSGVWRCVSYPRYTDAYHPGAEPTITWPFMTWADTGNMLLKRRNAANTAWVTLGPLFPGVTVATGSQTLSASQAGLVLINASGGNITLTLPPAADLPGAEFTFIRVDASLGSLVNITAGAGTIDASSAAINLVGTWDKRTFRSGGGASWYTQSVTPVSQATMYQSVNQNFSAATWTKVTLGAKTTDTGFEVSTANSRFTAKEAGWYAIDAQLTAIGATVVAGNTLALSVYVNGAAVDPGNLTYITVTGSNAVTRTNAHVFLAKGDYAEIFGRGGVGFSSEAGAQSTFAKFLRVR